MFTTEMQTWIALGAVGLAFLMALVLIGRLWFQFRDFWKWLS